MNLTPRQITALANCEYDKETFVLKCHKRTCHRQIDRSTNEEYCYWHWREQVKPSETRREWQEVN